MAHVAAAIGGENSVFFRSRARDPTSYFSCRSDEGRRDAAHRAEFAVFFTSRVQDPTSFFYKWSREATERAMNARVEFDAPGCKRSVAEAWARAQLAGADCVCFDVDSTVCVGEGIDDLAEHCGVGEEVKRWTEAAMGGSMKFEIALAARLDIIKPRLNDFHAAATKAVLTPGIKELVEALHARGTDVFLVSGGFRLMIEPVAAMLDINPSTNVYANSVSFDADGSYLSFDPTEPTSHDGGKAEALQKIIDCGGYQCAVMIGDGATDLQARPPAEAAIGFGANVVRPAVKENADLFVMSCAELHSIVTSDLAHRLSSGGSSQGSARSLAKEVVAAINNSNHSNGSSNNNHNHNNPFLVQPTGGRQLAGV